MVENENVLAKWNELKALVDDLELDVHKNAKGNSAAGVRMRKGLRILRNKVTDMVKLTVELDKEKKADKAARRKSE